MSDLSHLLACFEFFYSVLLCTELCGHCPGPIPLLWRAVLPMEMLPPQQANGWDPTAASDLLSDLKAFLSLPFSSHGFFELHVLKWA